MKRLGSGCAVRQFEVAGFHLRRGIAHACDQLSKVDSRAAVAACVSARWSDLQYQLPALPNTAMCTEFSRSLDAGSYKPNDFLNTCGACWPKRCTRPVSMFCKTISAGLNKCGSIW